MTSHSSMRLCLLGFANPRDLHHRSSVGCGDGTWAYAWWMSREEVLDILPRGLHDVKPLFQGILEQQCPSHCAALCTHLSDLSALSLAA